MTPLERAARALYEDWTQERSVRTEAALNGPHPMWPEASRHTKVFWTERARAVLQAIREPSEGMVEAALGYPLPKGLMPSSEAEIQALVEPGSCYHSWQAMIDAALEEG